MAENNLTSFSGVGWVCVGFVCKWQRPYENLSLYHIEIWGVKDDDTHCSKHKGTPSNGPNFVSKYLVLISKKTFFHIPLSNRRICNQLTYIKDTASFDNYHTPESLINYRTGRFRFRLFVVGEKVWPWLQGVGSIGWENSHELAWYIRGRAQKSRGGGPFEFL